MKLRNKVIVIMGAGTGLGREIGIKSAKEGAITIQKVKEKTNAIMIK